MLNGSRDELKITPKYWLLIFMPILVGIVLISFYRRCGNTGDYFQKHVLPENFDAVVVDKYEDKRNRYAKTLLLRRRDNSIFALQCYSWDKDEYLWDIASLGDRIKKDRGDSSINLYSKKQDSIYLFDFNFDRGSIYLLERND